LKGFKREKIWDPVTRLWHWLLVPSICVAWWLGEFMAFDNVEWHFYAGYVVLALMLFRLIWGFAGPVPVRFRSFIYTPKQTLQCLKTMASRNPSGYPGHNPIGSLLLLILLSSMTFQAISGLFIESADFFESAPLAGYISETTMKQLNSWHHLNAKLLLLLVGLHLCAIFYYLLWKKENLIQPMISGWKWVKIRPLGEEGSSD
jgi:cytochrome b